jgi:molybdate transport system regulatory protein
LECNNKILTILQYKGEFMKTSARNQLKGMIVEVKTGQVNTEVIVDLGEGAKLTAVITNDAKDDMGLKIGDSVYAIIKASFVIVAKEKPGKISTRNVLETTVEKVINGMVNTELKLKMGDHMLTSIITKDAEDELEANVGDTVYALIKANAIILAQ